MEGGICLIILRMESESWYGVRTHYELVNHSSGRDRVYEERIVIFRATSHEEAIAKAEKEAEEYCSTGSHYLGFAQSFEIFEDAPGEATEIYSLLRDSRMEPDRYLTKFFDTGRERTT